jgi:oxalate decarboxylase/phosphoglucose isomerase-like protein (cupin superfamily)
LFLIDPLDFGTVGKDIPPVGRAAFRIGGHGGGSFANRLRAPERGWYLHSESWNIVPYRRTPASGWEASKARNRQRQSRRSFGEDSMAKDAIVSDEFAKKFAAEKETPYTRWVKSEGLDLISSTYVPSLHTVELKPWARRGGRGVFLNHEASRTSNDCYVCEIPPGKTLSPQRQLFEETIMILSGRGSTTVWNDAGQRMTFEWKAGALFAIPLNCWHQHFNGSGRDPARFVSVTNAPIVINLYEDLDFIFGTNYDFKGRFNGEPDYFAAKDETKGFLLTTNFVPDAVNLPLIAAKERGAGGGHIRFNFAKSSLNSHISQFPIGTYKKAHAHGPGAHVIILSGEGYSLMWPEGDKPRYYKWEVGTMIVPPNMWLHQHFNTGTTPASPSATPRAYRRPGSASGSAATRSITPTRIRRRARNSSGSSPSTDSNPRWTRPTTRRR